MRRYKFAILLAVLMASSVLLVQGGNFHVQEVSNWDFPRLDTINMVEAYPWTVALTKAQGCDIDSFLGAIDPGSVEKLQGEGWSVTSSQGGFHLCRFSINCRAYTPASSGKYVKYHNRGPGFPLYPLNLTGFRLALNYIHKDSMGGYKTTWMYDIFKFIVIRLDWAVTPALAAWFNPYMTYYENSWEIAAKILYEEGWQGTPGVDNWIMPNGVPLRERIADPVTGEKGIYVMCPGDPIAPTSHEVAKRFTKAWNWFFMGVETTTGIFKIDPQATSAPLVLVMLYNRDHDINFLCLSLGRFPTYLYGIFNSEMDLEGGSNDAGLVNPSIDRLSRTFFYCSFKDYELLEWNIGDTLPFKTIPAGKKYTLQGAPTDVDKVVISNCSLIHSPIGVNDISLTAGVDYKIVGSTLEILKPIKLVDGASLEVLYKPCKFLKVLVPAADPSQDPVLWTVSALLQKKLFYAAPWVPVYSRDYIDIFKPGLVCWVESRGYGAGTQALTWTLCSIHWAATPVGGLIRWHVSGDVTTLNVIPARWVYEFQIINPLMDSLLNVNPYTHADMPWIAVKWKIEPWLAPGGVPGAKYTFWLRNDVYWHDGDQVTAHDIKWNWDYIASLKVAKWRDLWAFYQKGEVLNDYCVVAYANRTSYWDIYTYAGLALTFPPRVWNDTRLDTLAEATAFKPWAVKYSEWTGLPDPPDKPGLTCLYGTGPFWLVSWNEVDLAVLKKNENYFARKATKLQQNTQMAGLNTGTKYGKTVGTKVVPKIVKPFLDVVIINLDTKSECTFTWELWYGTIKVADGTATLPELGTFMKRQEIPPAIRRLIPSCVGTWTLKVRTPAGENKYEIEMAYLPGDVNEDGTVDMKDVTQKLRDYGAVYIPPPSTPHPRWFEGRSDVNDDGVVDMKDVTLCLANFGRNC